MLPLLLLKGSLIGLSIAMPMGPVGMLCLRYSLLRGKSFGITSGLGVALADGICGALAAIGLTAITTFVADNQTWLHLVGSLVLFYFGLATFLAKKRETGKEVIESGHLSVFTFMFLLTLTNPITLLSFCGIYAAFGLECIQDDLMAVATISTGIFAGSTIWWIVLAFCSSYFGGKVNESGVGFVNKLIGAFIMLISLVSLGNLMRFSF